MLRINVICRTTLWASLLLSGALAACGGGGGSGSSEPSVNPGSVDRQVPLALSGSNLNDVGTLALGYGEAALGFAQLAIDWVAAADAASTLSVTTPCVGGGSQTVALIDRDGNRRVTAGDQLTVSLAGCYLKPIEDAFDGTLTIDIATPGSLLQTAGTLTFGPQFGQQIGGVAFRVEGALRFEYAADGLSRVVRVLSSTQSFGFTASEGTKSAVDLLTQLDSRREMRRDTARAVTTMSYRVASDVLGGSLTVSTTQPWSSWFDSYPDAGELSIVGAVSRTAKLRASTTADGRLDVLLDGAALGAVLANGATSGYLWSGAPWTVQPNGFLGYVTQVPSVIGFVPLLEPTATALTPNAAGLVWAYSRPLAAGTLSSAKFVRTASGPGQNWAPAEIPADLRIDGALLTVTPSQQLEAGNSYTLMFDNQFTTPITDIYGATTRRPGLAAVVTTTITASARIEGPELLLGIGSTLALNATASSAPGGAVTATQWRQISGPTLSFTGADTPRAVVAPLAAGNGVAVVEVEVRNAAGEYDRQQLSFQVLADTSQSLVIGYRAGTAPTTVITSLDPGNSNAYARYFLSGNILDVILGTTRLLSALPGGTSWQTGTDVNYGIGGTSGVNVVWMVPGGRCDAPSGHLSVLDYAIDGNGTLTRLAIDFEDTCPASATTFGSVRFNSSLPLRP